MTKSSVVHFTRQRAENCWDEYMEHWLHSYLPVAFDSLSIYDFNCGLVDPSLKLDYELVVGFYMDVII